MRYLFNVGCALSGLLNALLNGRYPETVCMRVRRYRAIYKDDWPRRLTLFYIIERFLAQVNKAHLKKSWWTARKELNENLLKSYRDCRRD